ncbi:hypothetical protein OH77DRAFT_1434580 [Trametes cingulata]|nr:hypothetical protein OH77DRAFT_1434580 [Trametes cingulata]
MTNLRTYFACSNAQFTSAPDANSRGSSGEIWEQAKVYLTEIMEDSRWILITTGGERVKPVVWRSLKADVSTVCDEDSMTIVMEEYNSTTARTKIEQLRFASREDFWTFTAHYCFGRVHRYEQGNTDDTYNYTT